MKHLISKKTSVESDVALRALEHAHQARLARTAQRELGLTVEQIAEKSDVAISTARRFLGLDGDRNTRDPRTSTTWKVFGTLGYSVVLRKER